MINCLRRCRGPPRPNLHTIPSARGRKKGAGRLSEPILAYFHVKGKRKKALIWAIFWQLSRCHATGEERISDYLTRLPPRHVISRPEVWPALRVARLSHSTTRVPTHHPPRCKPHYLCVEGMSGRDI